MLTPLNFNRKSIGTVLVELKEAGEIVSPDKQYKSFHRGIVIAIAYTGHPDAPSKKHVEEQLLDKEVYFEEFKDSAQVEKDDKKYAFIKMEDIVGADIDG